MPAEVLDLDFFWNPEGDTSTANDDDDGVSDSQLARHADEIEFGLPSQVIAELATPFTEGKLIVWFTDMSISNFLNFTLYNIFNNRNCTVHVDYL